MNGPIAIDPATGLARSPDVDTTSLADGKYCFRTEFVSTNPEYTNLTHTNDPLECFTVSTPTEITRTQGYWQTHVTQVNATLHATFNVSDLSSGVCTDCSSDLLRVGGAVSGKTIDDLPSVFAAFHSSIAFDDNKNNKRTSLEHAKMQVMQQLMAAMLNCRAFGSNPGLDDGLGGTGLPILSAQCDAPVGTAAGNAINVDTDSAANRAELIRMNGILGAFNESGDNQDFPTGFVNSKALPKLAKGIAHSIFTDGGENIPGQTGIQGYDTLYWHTLAGQPFDI